MCYTLYDVYTVQHTMYTHTHRIFVFGTLFSIKFREPLYGWINFNRQNLQILNELFLTKPFDAFLFLIPRRKWAGIEINSILFIHFCHFLVFNWLLFCVKSLWPFCYILVSCNLISLFLSMRDEMCFFHAYFFPNINLFIAKEFEFFEVIHFGWKPIYSYFGQTFCVIKGSWMLKLYPSI